jgi:hypothetical protein
MCFPIDDFQCAVWPIVSYLHGFQQVRCVNGIANSLFKAAVDRFSINIKSNGAGGGKADKGAILAVLILVHPGVLICFNIELCQ